MPRGFFMQLLILLALVLMSGKGDIKSAINEVKPVLEEAGAENLCRILDRAEEFSGVMDAVKGLASQAEPESEHDGASGESEREPQEEDGFIGYPLAPIAAFADREITYSLSRYVQRA